MAGTAHAWLEAIAAENAFTQERDAPRIRAAFKSLASRRESWPAPRHFMDALPRVETRALGYEVKPASRAEAAAAMAKIAAMLKRADPEATMPEHDVDKAPLADVERALKEHYDGKTAAAGPDA